MNETLRDPIYDETKEKLERLGIKAVFFDLDDTLIYTQEIFTRYMEEFSITLAKTLGVSAEEVMGVLKEINDEEYKRMGVNPARWAAVLEQMSSRFPENSSDFSESLEILMKIYTTVPRVREGAEVVLEILKGLDIKVVLVTHANVDWTHFKLDQLGLWDYFDSVHIVNENGHKKSADWKEAMDNMEILPEECLVVGDSLSGDVRPGDELGARTMWVQGSTWSVYRQGQVPENTLPIEGVHEMLAALDRLR